jgi:hypothetical protein
MGHLGCFQEALVSDQYSELVEISKLNGDFRRNYGKLLGRYSLSALRQRRARPFLVLDRLGFPRLFWCLKKSIQNLDYLKLILWKTSRYDSLLYQEDSNARKVSDCSFVFRFGFCFKARTGGDL